MVTKSVGILALQGNFEMHARASVEAGAHVVFIKKPEELCSVERLIIPGGESTAMLKHFELVPAWWEAFNAFHRAGKAIFGTCAGLILLAKTVNPIQKSLGFLNVNVERNAYGRQIDSHTIQAKFFLNGEETQIDMPFIRAPKITAVASGVSPIAFVGHDVVMVQEGNVLGAACHPEAVTSQVHQYFLNMKNLKL